MCTLQYFVMLQAASIAGNLMIKHHHHDFPSDVFATTEALGSKVEIYGKFLVFSPVIK